MPCWAIVLAVCVVLAGMVAGTLSGLGVLHVSFSATNEAAPAAPPAAAPKGQRSAGALLGEKNHDPSAPRYAFTFDASKAASARTEKRNAAAAAEHGLSDVDDDGMIMQEQRDPEPGSRPGALFPVSTGLPCGGRGRPNGLKGCVFSATATQDALAGLDPAAAAAPSPRPYSAGPDAKGAAGAADTLSPHVETPIRRRRSAYKEWQARKRREAEEEAKQAEQQNAQKEAEPAQSE